MLVCVSVQTTQNQIDMIFNERKPKNFEILWLIVFLWLNLHRFLLLLGCISGPYVH